ncbi:hypothetical protein UF66_0929 [Staphylococcus cohnii subsp. cohnii]|uniref:Uncharacterized protein n=1 Tax=Staphylococcus cohnii subsp. cohnii TaxID=74704 RepID=A0A0M2NTC2_STACC|nr:hypothetical protein UF66_0929 [Staphylococcus cohnii subsp. cohnii]GEP88198.1 hypothetical protein SCO01_23880 [Staphylococcus cohnii subsp. cohnii]
MTVKDMPIAFIKLNKSIEIGHNMKRLIYLNAFLSITYYLNE